MKFLNNFLNLFCKNIKKDWKKKMRGSKFVFDSVDLLHSDLHKISLNKSVLNCPKWLKNKKATINPKNNDDKCFQYVVTVVLNYKTSKTIQKEYQKLSLSLTNIIVKK